MEVAVKTRKKAISGQEGFMTERQIKKKVGEAWALLKNPVYEKGLLVTAELLYYNADKAKVREQLREKLSQNKNGHYAFFFFGKTAPNVVYIL